MAEASTPQSLQGDSGIMSQNETFLKVKPSEELIFQRDDDTEPVYTFLALRNTSSSNVAFMVETNKPQTYVIPMPTGVLKPGGTTEVMVQLTPGQFCDRNDKMLVLSMEVNKETFTRQDLDRLWQTAPENRKARYNIRCRCISPNSDVEDRTHVKLFHPSKVSSVEPSDETSIVPSDVSPIIRQGPFPVSPFGTESDLLKGCQREFLALQQKLNSVLRSQASLKFNQRIVQLVVILMILLMVVSDAVPWFYRKPQDYFCHECGKAQGSVLANLLHF